MNKKDFFENLTSQMNEIEISLIDFGVNLLLTLAIAYIIGLVYVKYGHSLTNRKKLMPSLVLLSVIVMIVISIVKSSLALSLGLVGALSVVRFRTAIKEPEELVYFFLAIAVGLGLGANQRLITIIGVTVIVLYIILTRKQSLTTLDQPNLILNIVHKDKNLDERQIIEILKKYSRKIELRRMEQSGDKTELSFDTEFKNLDSMLNAKEELQNLADIDFSFIEKI